MESEIITNHQENSVITSSRPECDYVNCRTHNLYGTNVVECHEQKECQWVMHFGYSRFCKHETALHYANSKAA